MQSLKSFIFDTEYATQTSQHDQWELLRNICAAGTEISNILRTAGLRDVAGAHGSENIHGEQQQKLDVLAHHIFIEHLKRSEIVAGLASEESEAMVSFPKAQKDYLINIDPLDGSSNIDVNVCVGTIFSVYKRPQTASKKLEDKDFLQKGSQQLMSGYILYGAATMLVYTSGNGVSGFTQNPENGTFYLSHPNMKFPDNGNIFSISEGYYNQFPSYIKAYIDDCKAFPGRLHTARYVGSLVSDFHRNLIKGGIYAYPETRSAPKGKLRLVYECNPMALLAEQAGGLATDGLRRILSISPDTLHQTVPFVTGSTEMVEKLHTLHQPSKSN